MAASGAQRIKILRKFVRRNEHLTGAELERAYGSSVSLFLSRISSWFRVTLSYELGLSGTGHSIPGLGLQVRGVVGCLLRCAGVWVRLHSADRLLFIMARCWGVSWLVFK